MSRRNPTDYNAFIDENTIYPGKQIITTTPSQVADDQTFILDQSECVIAASFVPVRETGGAFVSFAQFNLIGTDVCAVSEDSLGTSLAGGELAYELFALVWNSNGTTAGQIRVTSQDAAGTPTLTYSILTTDTDRYTWHAFTGTLNVPTNGNTARITLAHKVTAGAGAVFCAGFAAFSPEL